MVPERHLLGGVRSPECAVGKDHSSTTNQGKSCLEAQEMPREGMRPELQILQAWVLGMVLQEECYCDIGNLHSEYC